MIQMIDNLSTSTKIFLFVILLVFAWFAVQLIMQWRLNRALKKAAKSDDTLESLKDGKLQALHKVYAASIAVETGQGVRTNMPASAVINDAGTTKAYGINLRLLDAAPGLLVGLGLFGTFWGLTEGINGFDSTTTKKILQSIQGLLGGMSTAFLTSLVGMGASIVFTWWDKVHKKTFYRRLDEVCDRLDTLFYIDDLQLAQMQQQQMADNMTDLLRQEITKQTEALLADMAQRLTYTNENGAQVAVANAVREILAENTQQTRALSSFSTDLAIELSQNFDEVLSKQMQQKILPLMENVDRTTQLIVEHIDQMAAQVAAPATDMIENVVRELKEGMAAIVDEFKSGLSQSATGELENLSHQLGTAAQSMADFPKNMENVSATLQATIGEVRTAISEISNTSAMANSTAMQKMQEQIAFATGAISNAIGEVKETMSAVTANMRQSLTGLADDVASKQTDLLALQEDTSAETRRLLDLFNQGLERMARLNDSISGTMNMFQQAQGQITGSTAHLQTIAGDMKQTTQLWGRSQSDYTASMEQLQQRTQRSIDGVAEMIDHTSELSADYVGQFQTIRDGLSGIFAELQTGLTEYSRTVQASTQDYLDQYSNSLTQTANALASAIEQLRDVTDMLTDALSQQKR